MATNRLFIFDPDTNSAVCIAKGYSCAWSSGRGNYFDKWMDDHPEYTGNITSTRLQLRTEGDMPQDAALTFEPAPIFNHNKEQQNESSNPV